MDQFLELTLPQYFYIAIGQNTDYCQQCFFNEYFVHAARCHCVGVNVSFCPSACSSP